MTLVAWIKMLQSTHIDQIKSAMNEWMDVYILFFHIVVERDHKILKYNRCSTLSFVFSVVKTPHESHTCVCDSAMGGFQENMPEFYWVSEIYGQDQTHL